MSLRLVRCPFCGKRFNVAGVPAGNRLRCGGCTAVLTVPRADAAPDPRFRLTRSVALQIAAGVAAGLVAAVSLYFALRPSSLREPPSPAPGAARTVARLEARAEAPSPELAGIYVDPRARPDTPLGRAVEAIQKEFGTRFVYYDKVQPYLIALEPADRYHATSQIKDYGLRLEMLHGVFRREFGEALRLPEVGDVLTVIVFNSRESFDKYCLERDRKRMPDAIKGIYEYERRRIVVYQDYNVPYDVLFHEGTHQLVHYFTLRNTGRKVATNYWFQEGLGTYFEGLRQRAGGLGVIDAGSGRERLPALKQAVLQQGQSNFVPLNVLVGMTVDEFWKWFEEGLRDESQAEEIKAKARLYYAESWALVHFLRQAGGNHQKVFDEYFRLEIHGKGGKDAFEDLVRAYLGTELPQLEAKFIEYIQNLR